MRLSLLLALCFAASAATAGMQQTCAPKKKQPAAYKSCIEAERRRAANDLRELNAKALHSINAHIKKTGEKKRLEDYRTAQANHVRQRQVKCNRTQGLQREICEGDMDFAQIRALQKYLDNPS